MADRQPQQKDIVVDDHQPGDSKPKQTRARKPTQKASGNNTGRSVLVHTAKAGQTAVKATATKTKRNSSRSSSKTIQEDEGTSEKAGER